MTRTRKRRVYGIDLIDNVSSWRLFRPIVAKVPVTFEGHQNNQRWPINSQNLGQQVTVDENHGSSWRSHVQRRTRAHFSGSKDFESWDGDIGGPFSSVRYKVYTHVGGSQHLYNPTWRVSGSFEFQDHYLGPVLAVDPGGVLGVAAPTLRTNTELEILGTTAINRCAPTNNVANLFTSISELYRDGLPKALGATLWADRTRAAKAAGGEYLNTEYGWLPLVGDIQDTVYAAKHSHELLSSYEENAGKVVRRKYRFPDEVTATVTDLGESDGAVFSTINLNPDTSKPKPHLLRMDKSTRMTWFSGAFTYHLPYDYKSRNRMRSMMAKAGTLYGIELTPESVWNATPWSWATNWFSDLGDVVENVSRWATDGQVLRYGYLMEHVISERTYLLDRVTRYKPYGTIWAAPVSSNYESKRRVVSSPFGFGLKGIDLSPTQWAITLALGLSFH